MPEYKPVYFGTMDCESEYVLEHFGIESPTKVFDINDADKIILVDTHHVAQLTPNFPIDKVSLIYDHHPRGDDNKFPNALIDNREIGAAASIIAEKYFDIGIDDKKMLHLLGMVIVSNTVKFTAATTAKFDHDMFARITQRYPISETEIKDMFDSRANILKRGLHAAATADIKIFDTPYGQIGISQLGVPGLAKVIDTNAMKTVLFQIAQERRLEYFLMNAGDVDKNSSIVISANPATTKLLIKHFEKPFINDIQKFDRLLYRKKDFLFK